MELLKRMKAQGQNLLGIEKYSKSFEDMKKHFPISEKNCDEILSELDIKIR